MLSTMQATDSPPIDNDSRSSWYRESEENMQRMAEEAPLLRPRNTHNFITNIVVILLLITLLLGVIIGIYLLSGQNRAENGLPPLHVKPFRLVNRSEWDRTPRPSGNGCAEPFVAKTVIIEQTDTKECDEHQSCLRLLNDIKPVYGANYNFLVSVDGTAYEVIGWSKLSPLYPELSAIVFVFIGDFIRIPPPIEQIVTVKSLIAQALKKKLLVKDFAIIGKYNYEKPRYLFEIFQDFPRWKVE